MQAYPSRSTLSKMLPLCLTANNVRCAETARTVLHSDAAQCRHRQCAACFLLCRLTNHTTTTKGAQQIQVSPQQQR